jgi:Skp family chaperone for outer membrane proteins
MKRVWILLGLVWLMGVGLACQAQPTDALTSKSVGYIDYERVVANYHQAQILGEEVKSNQADLEKMQADLNRQLHLARQKDAKASLSLEKSLQEQLNDKVKEYRSGQEAQAKKLESEVRNTVRIVAEKNKLGLVLSQKVVFLGGTEITDQVLNLLNAKPQP